MELINVVQLLLITFLLVLFTSSSAADVLLTDTVPLTSMYVSLQSHNLISPFFVSYAPCLSLFIPTQILF